MFFNSLLLWNRLSKLSFKFQKVSNFKKNFMQHRIFSLSNKIRLENECNIVRSKAWLKLLLLVYYSTSKIKVEFFFTKFRAASFSKKYFNTFKITDVNSSQLVYATWYSLENKLSSEERKMFNWIWNFSSQRSWQARKVLLEEKCSGALAWTLQVNEANNAYFF